MHSLCKICKGKKTVLFKDLPWDMKSGFSIMKKEVPDEKEIIKCPGCNGAGIIETANLA